MPDELGYFSARNDFVAKTTPQERAELRLLEKSYKYEDHSGVWKEAFEKAGLESHPELRYLHTGANIGSAEFLPATNSILLQGDLTNFATTRNPEGVPMRAVAAHETDHITALRKGDLFYPEYKPGDTKVIDAIGWKGELIPGEEIVKRWPDYFKRPWEEQANAEMDKVMGGLGSLEKVIKPQAVVRKTSAMPASVVKAAANAKQTMKSKASQIQKRIISTQKQIAALAPKRKVAKIWSGSGEAVTSGVQKMSGIAGGVKRAWTHGGGETKAILEGLVKGVIGKIR